MKKIIILILGLWSLAASAQTVGQFRYDTTKFLKVGGRNHVVIENLIQTSDSTGKPLVVGADGVIKRNTYWPGSGGVTVSSYGKNATLDSTVLVLSDGTRYAAKDSVGAGGGGATAGISQLGYPAYGLTRVNDSTYIADSTVLASKAYVDAKDTLKQNLVTLTTTGTSGAATFNQTTGALNIPQYAGGSGSSAKAYAPLLVRNDSIYQRYNVRAYGATGDSTQDATPFIQNAINACIAGGGGTVYFPNGFYSLSSPLVTSIGGANPNSQLYIPPISFKNGRTAISFLGESKPNFTPAAIGYDTTYSRVGAIIKSTITGSGIAPAVFGGKDISGITFHYVSFENLTILVKSNAGGTGPTMSGINGLNYASIQIDNCIVGIDTSIFRSSLPQNDAAGIITTKRFGETMSSIKNTMVYGFRYGYFLGEHINIENAFAGGNYVGFAVQTNAHPGYATKMLSQWNVYDVLFPSTTILGVSPGSAFFNVASLSVEMYSTNAKWYNNVATLTDSAAYASGSIFYNVRPGGGSTGNQVFVKYGTNSTFSTYNIVDGLANLKATSNTFSSGNTSTSVLIDATGSSPTSLLGFQKNGVSKWSIFTPSGTNFGLYDYKNTVYKMYLDTVGNMHFGGIPNNGAGAAGAALSIDNSKNISFNNYAFYWDATNNRLGLGYTTPTDKISLYGGSGDVYLRWHTASTGVTNTDGFNLGVQNSTNDIYFTQRESANIFFFANGSEAMRINNAQRIGIGGISPTAILHLKAGTATASTAPLKFTSGTVNTTPEAGAVEFDGTNYWVTTTGAGRVLLVRTVTGTAAPATTPATVGMQFVDTVNKKLYVATGTSSSADWTILN